MAYLHRVVCFAVLLLVGCSDGREGAAGGSNYDERAGASASAATVEPTYTRDWVVSPSGSDSNAGTAGSPFRTINRGIRAASAGERVLVMPGTYAERIAIFSEVRSGTAAQPIRLQGQGMPKIVPAESSATMVQVGRSYWQIDGFDIDARSSYHMGVGIANAQGVSVSGSHIHHGSHNRGISISSNAADVLIENNEIDHFWRTPIDDSHGIGIEWTTRNIVIRNNRIHENSGDSIQCEGPETYADGATPADNVLIEGNEMYGDYEQAVDIKTCSNVRIANNWIHDYTQYPGGCPMVIHMSAREVLVEGNRFYNVGNAIAIGGNHIGPVPYHVVVRRNLIWGVHKSGSLLSGIGIWLENSDQARIFNNTIWNADFAAVRAGGCDQGDTSGLISRNNILAPSPGGYAYYFGPCMRGLASGPNLLTPNATISTIRSGSRVNLSLASWQATGQEGGSRAGDPQLDPSTLTPGPVAVDWGMILNYPYCGRAPDMGGVETGCP